jgi:transposase-like protein
MVDATYLKVRRGTRVVSHALLITAGIRQGGFREILSIDLMDSEREGFWFDHFELLKERDLHGVQLVISDGHKGIQNAVKRAFIGSSWQMFHVYLHRIIKSKGIRKFDVKTFLILSELEFRVISRLSRTLYNSWKRWDIRVPLQVLNGFPRTSSTTERSLRSTGNISGQPIFWNV